MNAWHPRADFVELSHRWQIVFLLFLVGSLVGWGIGFILPSPYRSETTFYVAFNADPFARNPDDYKNWYLSQLEIFAFSDGILNETLNRLQAQEAYWSTVSSGDLMPRLNTYWRSAGKWRLVAEWTDRDHAFQLGQTWSAVFFEQVTQSIADAYSLIEINAQISSTSTLLTDINYRILQIGQVKAGLQTWQAGLTPTNSSLPLDPLRRWRLLSLAATLVDFNPFEPALINEVPSPESLAQAYTPWVELLLTSADNQMMALQEQADKLSEQLGQLQQSLEENVQASNGLTIYLVIEPLEDTLPAEPVRRSNLMALVGGSLAVLAYLLFWLARPLKKDAP